MAYKWANATEGRIFREGMADSLGTSCKHLPSALRQDLTDHPKELAPARETEGF